MSLLITTCPGLEDVALRELNSLLSIKHSKIKPQGVQGRLIVEVWNNIENAILTLINRARTIHRVSVLLTAFKISRTSNGLNEIYNGILRCHQLNQYITPKTSFAIRAERLGRHEYTSIDIARIAGQAVIELTSTSSGSRPKVDLEHPNIIVRVDVVGETCLVSICTTGDESLHKRGYRVYNHPAALKPTIAYAMAMLSQIRAGSVILDPMCGGGTIPIECFFLDPSLLLYGMDISPKHVHGAKLNALAAGLIDKILFRVGDARKLDSEVNFDIDRIISNLPYGIRIGRRNILKNLYKGFLKSARKVLKDDGLITILTTELRLIKRIADEHGYLIREYRRIFHGNLSPFIIILEKT